MVFGQAPPLSSPLGPVDPKLLIAERETQANEAASSSWSVVNFFLGAGAAFGVWYFYLRKHAA